MKEKNRNILKNSIWDLPKYSAPDRLWKDIDIEFNYAGKENNRHNLSKAVDELPVYSPEDDLWNKIESNINGKRKTGLVWYKYAAGLITIFVQKSFNAAASVSASVKVAVIASATVATVSTIYIVNKDSEEFADTKGIIATGQDNQTSGQKTVYSDSVDATIAAVLPDEDTYSETVDNRAVPDVFSVANLVINPSFEEFGSLPFGNTIDRTYFQNKNWTSPTTNPPNVYSSEIPDYCWANTGSRFTEPKTGSVIMGIQVHAGEIMDEFSVKASHEYIQARLKEPLEPGNRYYVEFWVRRSQESPLAANNIGIYFSDEMIYLNSTGTAGSNTYLDFEPQIIEKNVIVKSNRWTRISGTYIPELPASYFIIGNFYSDENTRTREFKSKNFKQEFRGAYYFIDDVFIKLLDDYRNDRRREYFAESKDDRPLIRFRPFYYRDKVTALSEDDYIELEGVIEKMMRYPDLKIEIKGYSCNEGANTAEERARIIYSYLFSNGIDKKRMKIRYLNMSRALLSPSKKTKKQFRKAEIIIR